MVAIAAETCYSSIVILSRMTSICGTAVFNLVKLSFYHDRQVYHTLNTQKPRFRVHFFHEMQEARGLFSNE